jgi:hypothetical protein
MSEPLDLKEFAKALFEKVEKIDYSDMDTDMCIEEHGKPYESEEKLTVRTKGLSRMIMREHGQPFKLLNIFKQTSANETIMNNFNNKNAEYYTEPVVKPSSSTSRLERLKNINNIKK